MSRDKQECGCVHDGTYWIKMCAPCEKEWNIHHAQALEDYRRTVKEKVIVDDPETEKASKRKRKKKDKS